MITILLVSVIGTAVLTLIYAKLYQIYIEKMKGKKLDKEMVAKRNKVFAIVCFLCAFTVMCIGHYMGVPSIMM